MISVPKRRPPSPHSDNSLRSPRRQRAATNPSTVTNANKTTNTASAVALGVTALFLLSFFGAVDRVKKQNAQEDPEQLVPIKERDAEQRRRERVVGAYPQKRDVRRQQKKMVKTKTPARHRSPPAFHTRFLTA